MTPDTVVRIATKGEGVTAAGRYAALAAPGDVIGPDGAVLHGPHHAIAPCRHFPRCGGCQLQHVDDAAYSEFLIGRIGSALAAQGVSAPTIRTPHLSPPRTRRRATLRAQRLGRTVLLGFNEEASHKIVDMRECHVLRPELFALLDPLRGLLSEMMVQRSSATVSLTMADQGIDLAVEGVAAEGLRAHEALIAFAQEHRLARVSLDIGYGLEPRWEPERLTVSFDHVAVDFPARSFLQATEDGERAIVDAAREAVGCAGHIVDLFSGLGTIGLPLSRMARVHAVEGARDAVLALQAGSHRAQRPMTTEHRDLFRRPLSIDELARFDAVVLDPPRAGAREQVDSLMSGTCGRLAYVSCNAATFARDAALLQQGGWRVDWIQPVGQFRWSTHLELVASLRR